jgi:hypothetical protein
MATLFSYLEHATMIRKAYYRVGLSTDRIGWRIGNCLIARVGWRILIRPNYFT